MLTSLEARDFRNLEPLRLELGSGRQLFLGRNGAGKTSLLEAVYLLATTRSFRTPRVAECARHGASEFRLAGETDDRRQLEVYLDSGQRERRLNGERVALADHLAALPVIAWTAGDGEVLTGPPDERRRFMDRGVLGLRPAALEVISRYRRALDGKKELLRSHRSRPIDPMHLAVWNDLQAQATADLAALRSRYVEKLALRLAEVLADADLGLPEVKIEYRPSPKEALDGMEAVRRALEDSVPKELELQQPLVGPQRDDLAIRWHDRSLKRIASAGERKALGLVLLLAHGRILEAENIDAVMLLDDIDVELDPERLARLWATIDRRRQVLVTSARPAVWERLDIDQTWSVTEGRVESAC